MGAGAGRPGVEMVDPAAHPRTVAAAPCWGEKGEQRKGVVPPQAAAADSPPAVVVALEELQTVRN